MGLYDREYSRDPEAGYRLTPPQSLTAQLVLVTAAVYLAQLASPQVSQWLSLHADWYRRPWQFYQLLTYGFLHDPDSVEHIFINMLVLWMFGRELEARLGRSEFLALYLTSIIVAGAFWSLSEVSFAARTGATPHATLVGASGGISALFALFALLYPRREILFMFFIPMPMWLAAAIGIAIDVRGALVRSGNIACTAHLAGAVFGLYYYKLNWQLAPFYGRLLRRPGGVARPRLRVHEPDAADEADDLAKRVDEILQKIQEQGQDSLTSGERKLLERASRRYQQKRK